MADKDQVARLKAGADGWNKWRNSSVFVHPFLSNANLSMRDASRPKLRMLNSPPAMQSNADLQKVRPFRADLKGADLQGANLDGVDLSEADLRGADLRGADLSHADLSHADLRGANLFQALLVRALLSRADLKGADLGSANLLLAYADCADLRGADLRGANLSGAYLTNANLGGADLHEADLYRADLCDADLSHSNLRYAELGRTQLVATNLQGADLTGCNIYGASVWDICLDDTTVQTNLDIAPPGESAITVDDLEVAQFIYLILHSEKLRNVIDTIAKKLVLILGRFTPERLVILDALRTELRRRNYLPVVFDFAKPSSRDLTETVSTLAHMARFVIADLTDAKSIPQELSVIVPNLPSVAIQPLIQSDDTEYAMFEHWQRFHSVLDTYRYEHLDALLKHLKEQVIDPAERRANEIAPQDKQDKTS